MGIRRNVLKATLITLLLFSSLTACQAGVGPVPPDGISHADEMPVLAPAVLSPGARLQIVATTSIVADVVRNVGRDGVEVRALIPPGSDPHSYEPTPKDLAAVADAHAVFTSGAGLEAFLERLVESAGGKTKVVPVSYGIALQASSSEHDEEDAGEHSAFDPHVWFDPNNVAVWVHNIRDALSALNPIGAERYAANAAEYESALRDLDAWIRSQVNLIPEASRSLVTDHTVFTYFAARYGFRQVGAILPGYSTLASPSAQELARLEQAIRAHGVKAVFIGETVNPSLAQRVAQDTGTRLVFVYTGSLGSPTSPAGTYLDMMRHNVAAIVGGLR